MDKVIEKLIELMPLWCVIIIAIMFVAMKFYYTRFKVIEDKTKHADCQNKNGKIDLLASDIANIKDDIAAIKTVLIQKFPNAAIILSMKKSPRRLNETGEWVFNQINGEQFLKENKEFFFSKIDDMKPLTALDVESAANYACAGYTDSPIFNDIKLYIYNAPSITIKNEEGKEKQYDLTLGDVCFTLSIPLRDMYLKEHPEIPR